MTTPTDDQMFDAILATLAERGFTPDAVSVVADALHQAAKGVVGSYVSPAALVQAIVGPEAMEPADRAAWSARMATNGLASPRRVGELAALIAVGVSAPELVGQETPEDYDGLPWPMVPPTQAPRIGSYSGFGR